jgi:hypothetical protein
VTWLTDDTGRRWVEGPPRKRRKSPRALRFAEIKVGDQLMRRWPELWRPAGTTVWYYVVSDLWFDPCAGQRDETAGRMVAIQRMDGRTGEPVHHKEAHTIRGLASQGFRYADVDYIAHVKAALTGVAEGAVVGIGMAHIIRRRPKQAGRPL